MREWLTALAETAVVLINGVAVLTVIAGTVEAFVKALKVVATSGSGHKRRDTWLRYSRWLVAGLTFQLAADIIESSITHGWEAIARLGTVAVIRTFLNYFLSRDIAEVRELQREASGPADAP